MSGGRIRGLLVVIGLCAVVILARLAQIQVLQHRVWAAEAARIGHSGEVLPFRRGSILDAGGRVLATDVDAYHLVFSYRAFRRNHPLGQVAHARSALAMRAVSLDETWRSLIVWGDELVRLTPADVEAFSEGGALATPTLTIGETEDEPRRRRASDVRFYVRGLLGASNREWNAVDDLAEEGGEERSYLDLLAEVRDRDPERLGREVARNWQQAMEHLAFLARRVDLGAQEAAGVLDDTTLLALLVGELEEARRDVEDAVASSLFEEATGFPVGRIASDTLVSGFDLEPIRLQLAWSQADLAAWAVRARSKWLGDWRDGYALPRLLAQMTLDPAHPPGPDDVLSHLAALFAGELDLERALDGAPTDWRELTALAVLPGLEDALRADAPEDLDLGGAVVLPFRDERLRSWVVDPAQRWSLLERARADGGAGVDRTSDAAAWRGAMGRSAAAREDLARLADELVGGWEEIFQASLRSALESIRAAADPEDELDPQGRLRLRSGAFERASERARYIQRDYGGRQKLLDDRPDYDVVYLLTRYPERYPGFGALQVRRRVRPVLPGDARPLAEGLVGSVGSFGVRDMQGQRADERRLRYLRGKPTRSEEEERELVELVASVRLPDEARGVAGVEGFWDPELRGTNGYREHLGTEDVVGENKTVVPVVEAVDGADVTLTLVAEVQRAAERTIQNPEPRWDDKDLDVDWFANPVGAIVVMTVEGDVIAAASAPAEGPDAFERTLRRPTFNPPGSVFKPFVAAWALDRLGLDPHVTVDCVPMPEGHAGYEGVRCWRRAGHGTVDLDAALVGSCNSYFAWLGSTYGTSDFRALADAFGFGQGTGVRTPPRTLEGDALVEASLRPRLGLAEDPTSSLFQRELNLQQLLRAGNGLSVVEATPMQVARATAGLASGELPSARLVAAVGDQPLLAQPSRPVPVSRASLERVRASLAAVTGERRGTAWGALNPDQLGFAIAAKTGSADLQSRRTRDGQPVRVRKHTWVAGWLPVDRPEVVFVVFLNDTSSTSSHGAVYVAHQLLTQPELQDWLVERGTLPAAGEEAR